jgi:DNA-binding NarL/FixJ family response regulator
MKKPYSVVIADDHALYREGMKSLLSAHPDLKVVGEGDGAAKRSVVLGNALQICFMDVSMPSMTGLDAAREIKRISPQIKIIMHTVHSAEEYVLSSLHAGADGYVLKGSDSAELLTAIRYVMDGQYYLSPSVSGAVILDLFKLKEDSATPSEWKTITPREREILKLVAEGHKSREIAEMLCISVKTVGKHRSNLMKKPSSQRRRPDPPRR